MSERYYFVSYTAVKKDVFGNSASVGSCWVKTVGHPFHVVEFQRQQKISQGFDKVIVQNFMAVDLETFEFNREVEDDEA